MTATTLPPVEAERRQRLEKIARRADDITRQRDREIALAFLSGASLREIADAVGLSHTGVKKIIDRTTIIGVKPTTGPIPLREAMGMDIWEFTIAHSEVAQTATELGSLLLLSPPAPSARKKVGLLPGLV